MKITIDEAAPGCGKTYRALNNAISFPAKYLFVTERVEAIHTIEAECRRYAEARGRHVRIVSIDADNTRLKSVREDVEALPNYYRDDTHVIAICSHAALVMSYLGDFADWHLIIDEVPTILSTQTVRSCKDLAFFEEHYTLSPDADDSGWSVFGLTKAGRALTGTELANDDSHIHLRAFHNRVTESVGAADQTSAVRCDLQSFAEMMEIGRVWIWGALFSLNALAAFETRTILANRFRESLSYKLLTANNPSVEWINSDTVAHSEFATRTVRIVYFSKRKGTSYQFKSPEGRSNLRKIARYIAPLVSANRFIWTANSTVAPYLTRILPRWRFINPKQAGSNDFVSCDSAAILYSAKASPSLAALLESYGVTSTDWLRTTEFETVLQFVTRTSVRNEKSTAPLTFYVYDRDQAQFLETYFADRPHTPVTTEFVDLDLDNAEKPRGRKVIRRSIEETAALDEQRRAKRAEAARSRRAAAKAVA